MGNTESTKIESIISDLRKIVPEEFVSSSLIESLDDLLRVLRTSHERGRGVITS